MGQRGRKLVEAVLSPRAGRRDHLERDRPVRSELDDPLDVDARHQLRGLRPRQAGAGGVQHGAAQQDERGESAHQR
jgi:hypothetical protein